MDLWGENLDLCGSLFMSIGFMLAPGAPEDLFGQNKVTEWPNLR